MPRHKQSIKIAKIRQKKRHFTYISIKLLQFLGRQLQQNLRPRVRAGSRTLFTDSTQGRFSPQQRIESLFHSNVDTYPISIPFQCGMHIGFQFHSNGGAYRVSLMFERGCVSSLDSILMRIVSRLDSIRMWTCSRVVIMTRRQVYAHQTYVTHSFAHYPSSLASQASC